MTEIRAMQNTGFYGKFQSKSDPVIRNSDPDKAAYFCIEKAHVIRD